LPENPPDVELTAHQREVQRLYGRTMLRLQMCEQVFKKLLRAQRVAFTWNADTDAPAGSTPCVDKKTLGQLVETLFDGFLRDEVDDRAPDSELGAKSPRAATFSFNAHLAFPASEIAHLKTALAEFVALRNELAHHFVETNDLFTVDGNERAREVLLAAYPTVEGHYQRAKQWLRTLAAAHEAAGQFLASATFKDSVVDRIAPDGSVDWQHAGIVDALREACRELAVDGWVRVDAAKRWIATHRPSQTVDRYGVASLREAIHHSSAFELRYREIAGQRAAWYRLRAT